MRQLGIALRSFGANQLSYQFCHQINKYLEENYTDEIVGFQEIALRCPFKKKFSVMDLIEIVTYQAPVVVTTFELAEYQQTLPAYKRIYYMYDLEWLGMSHDKHYKRLKNVYCDKGLNIVCPTKEYADIFQEIWQREVNIIENCDIGKFYERFS